MGLNYICLKFFVYIEQILDMKITVRDLQVVISFGLAAATNRRHLK